MSARDEAEHRWPSPNSGLYEGLVSGFVLGAEWAANGGRTLTEAEARAVVTVDHLASSTGMSVQQVVDTVNSINRAVTDEMVAAALNAYADTDSGWASGVAMRAALEAALGATS